MSLRPSLGETAGTLARTLSQAQSTKRPSRQVSQQAVRVRPARAPVDGAAVRAAAAGRRRRGGDLRLGPGRGRAHFPSHCTQWKAGNPEILCIPLAAGCTRNLQHVLCAYSDFDRTVHTLRALGSVPGDHTSDSMIALCSSYHVKHQLLSVWQSVASRKFKLSMKIRPFSGLVMQPCNRAI